MDSIISRSINPSTSSTNLYHTNKYVNCKLCIHFFVSVGIPNKCIDNVSTNNNTIILGSFIRWVCRNVLVWQIVQNLYTALSNMSYNIYIWPSWFLLGETWTYTIQDVNLLLCITIQEFKRRVACPQNTRCVPHHMFFTSSLLIYQHTWIQHWDNLFMLHPFCNSLIQILFHTRLRRKM